MTVLDNVLNEEHDRSTGVTAQALRHLDLLKKNTMKVQYFGIEAENRSSKKALKL